MDLDWSCGGVGIDGPSTKASVRVQRKHVGTLHEWTGGRGDTESRSGFHVKHFIFWKFAQDNVAHLAQEGAKAVLLGAHACNSRGF